ncbi:uncharacterized protein FIBRA_09424 [Fibroporia radiculosa]|uniref:RNA helicase n=1 Tax=Fibroporia radiculosa TaxID=599839 RepID=J7RHM4_9APHY|nr:uncharacterized protein FIBRA_09424 [Fibroporia radiculosa]CCM07097.1 predicted protein [Fibroporia radiculosa]
MSRHLVMQGKLRRGLVRRSRAIVSSWAKQLCIGVLHLHKSGIKHLAPIRDLGSGKLLIVGWFHMRLAFLLRSRRRLMQLDPQKRSPQTTPPLKRLFSAAPSSSFQALADPDGQRPGKIPKLESKSVPSSSMPPPPHPRRKPGPGPSLLSRMPSSGPSHSSGGKSRRGKASAMLPKTLPDPFCDEAYIARTYRIKPLKPVWEENPKSPLANFLNSKWSRQPEYETIQGIGANGKTLWRATVKIRGDEWDITGTGDHAIRRDAEKLAALSAMYQMDALGVFDQKSAPKRQKKSEPEPEVSPSEVKLSDGSVVDYERGRQFMDYYCRRFGFGRPEISYTMLNPRSSKSYWQADMTVDGRRIGFGKGGNKKMAMTSCYVDVTQYLEQCDPDIWSKFVQDARTGKDLGLAPKVLFQIDEALQEKVEDLCDNIQKSTLYKNRPSRRPAQLNGDASGSANPDMPTGPRAPYRRPVPLTWLESRSQQLRARRESYLNDSRMSTMRAQRAALPVYTKSDDLLKHIRDHDVTICMAATGSGKTTQIPQLILDDMIDRGEGAKCNIVCTQPRRIAAISVADRVAKERGEVVGKGSSIGYQVRFESNLPEEHGSVTFCTTGIFLKRMQSALLGGGPMGRSLDDVTHVLVDEVHERDVDTDLLLVVLKRLLAERKSRNKPIKIVLMSATIDPKLFQEYFRDEEGRPTEVIEIPGRAFPVEKHYLDDFSHDLAGKGSSSGVFQDESVQKYLVHQLGAAAPVPPGRGTSRPHGSNNSPSTTAGPPESSRDEDIEIPIPLVALTVAHVLRKTDDGHVLVFLPGWDDIIAVQRFLREKELLGLNFNDSDKFRIHLLHSTIPVVEQQAIFDPPPQGIRRIILATNIAETSVTIPDVVYVVDSARVKEQRYDPERHISSLVSAWVGKSNLNQRAGRAGRHRSGEYYGILGRKFADNLHPHQMVEMKRVDLSNVVMHVKALNFPGMTVEEVLAETIEPPSPDRVAAAMKALQMVGALDQGNDLTSLGRVLLQLPVDVQMGRLVLYGSFFRCLDQALTLAAILTNRDPFVSPMHLKAEANARKNSFTSDDFRSDALATLNAYNSWWELQRKGMYVAANKFCGENFLAKPTLLMIQKIKEHIMQSLYSIGIIDVSAGGNVSIPAAPLRGGNFAVPPELNRNGGSSPVLAALIAIATQPKFALRTGEKTYRTATDKTAFIHPSSVNHRKREILEHEEGTALIEKQIISYAEKRQNISAGVSNAQKFLVTTSRLDPLTYLLFGAYRIEVTARGLECDEWLPIVGRQDALDELEQLKITMQACMLRVFEGIIARQSQPGRRRNHIRNDGKEEESGDEDDAIRPLTGVEVTELDLMAEDIVNLLNSYSKYRVSMQSRQNSRPATPMDSPSFLSSRLPSLGGSRSGYSTPYHVGSTFSSRPSTPSRLSRRL